MRKIYLDIETIPTQVKAMQDYITASVKPPGTIKKAESIEKWNQEDRPAAVDAALASAAFDGGSNHIICIGVAFDDAPADAFILNKIEDEAMMLQAFYNLIQTHTNGHYDFVFVGHNINNFDMKVLKQRSIVLGVKPPAVMPFKAKPWDGNPYDTMVQWAGVKDSVKLDKLATIFGIPGKSMDGSQVYKMWLENKQAEIKAYCIDDVELTRKVYKKMEYIA